MTYAIFENLKLQSLKLQIEGSTDRRIKPPYLTCALVMVYTIGHPHIQNSSHVESRQNFEREQQQYKDNRFTSPGEFHLAHSITYLENRSPCVGKITVTIVFCLTLFGENVQQRGRESDSSSGSIRGRIVGFGGTLNSWIWREEQERERERNDRLQ